MPTLTLEAVRENPWNVVVQTLPTHPEPLLLELAYLAADYCRSSEHRLTLAARAGRYIPPGWEAARDCQPDAHEESEARACDADRKLLEICARYETAFGRPLQL